MHQPASGSPAQGVERIRAAFAQAHAAGRAAFMPYQMLGHPTPDVSTQIVAALAGAGADLFELGVPFSDPLADGPTIQAAGQTALDNGVTIARCLEMARDLRRRLPKPPFCLMGYVNPILAFGVDPFLQAAASAGIDGLIVPDLPPDEPEAEELATGCAAHGIAPIYLLAPTSTAQRIELGVQRSRGFVYLVTVTGITGARAALPAELGAFVQRVRRVAEQRPAGERPYIAVGFGIGTPELAAQAAQLADGVIVGSALVKLASGPEPAAAVAGLARSLAQATRRPAIS
jgi:tryptophan synthase alpha chain